jgi:hopanoid biosynthesis associated radical SAM protein HpnH
MWTVATYVLRQKLAGRKRYPLVLMLEPLFRCNLACAGCGKIQYPAHILKTDLSSEDCFKAVDECGAPMVSIPGGEPLMHPQIAEIVEGLVVRKKYIYLCTNALLLKEKLHLFKPSRYLSFSVHVDGQKEHHDFSVCREGGFDIALDGIRADAMQAGLNPVHLPEFQHRKIVKTSPGGHTITEFVGTGTIFKQMSRPVRHVAYIGTRDSRH